SRHGIHAGAGRSGHDVMSRIAKTLHKPAANQSAAADDDDFHEKLLRGGKGHRADEGIRKRATSLAWQHMKSWYQLGRRLAPTVHEARAGTSSRRAWSVLFGDRDIFGVAGMKDDGDQARAPFFRGVFRHAMQVPARL